MVREVDALKHLDLPTRAIVAAWGKREPLREIPFTPLLKPLFECRIALLSSAGLVRTSDTPFDQEGERKNPWWGDPSFRILPREVRTDEVRCCHLHINGRTMESDINCALPVDRLKELAAEGIIGEVAPRHISTMGYVLHTETLEQKTVPAVAELFLEDGVDAVVLAPVWPFCCRSVGLVARVLEEKGLSTVTLSPIWTFTASVGAPRIAAVEYPNGLGFGIPGDSEGQRAVLRATLEALVQIREPGGVVHLPFEWKPVRGVRLKPQPMPPIAALCIKKPWLLKKLIYGPVPEK